MDQENPEYYDENQEIWRECIGYEGLYLVSNFGRVKSLYPSTRIKDKENYVMAPKIDNHGYKRVNLHKDKNNKAELISRLVANTFIPNPENKPMVGHWDDDKLNNNVDNLYWTDSYENSHHNGKYEKFLKAHNDNIENIAAKLSKPIIAINIETGETIDFSSIQSASRTLGIDSGKISNCCNGKRNTSGGYKFIWKY